MGRKSNANSDILVMQIHAPSLSRRLLARRLRATQHQPLMLVIAPVGGVGFPGRLR